MIYKQTPMLTMHALLEVCNLVSSVCMVPAKAETREIMYFSNPQGYVAVTAVDFVRLCNFPTKAHV